MITGKFSRYKMEDKHTHTQVQWELTPEFDTVWICLVAISW